MKKSIISLFVFCVYFISAQENNSWRLGVEWGFQGNYVKQSGGMSEANGRFQANDAGAGAFHVYGRYDLDSHWMLLTGLGINSYGFEYTLANNYNLASGEDKYTHLSQSNAGLEIPILFHYKFNPNCKNSRWVVGLGIVQCFTGGQSISNFDSQTLDIKQGLAMHAKSNFRGGTFNFIRASVGREKTFRNGSILNFSCLFNLGVKTMADSEVNYFVDGKEYNHSFTNSGNFFGFRMAYYFKPFPSK